MTLAPGPHLSPDDVELWLNGSLDAARTRHLDLCPECFDRAQAEREIVEQLAALPLMAPSPGFADRVMAQVTVADPLALRGLASNFIEQPWYESARAFFDHPGRLAAALGALTLTYLSGMFALRRLLALPSQQVAHAA